MTRPQVGLFYTMSILKHPCKDRSYTHDVWEVLAQNGSHAVIKSVTARYEHSFGREPILVLVDEFDWSPAGDLVAELSQHLCPDFKATGAP